MSGEWGAIAVPALRHSLRRSTVAHFASKVSYSASPLSAFLKFVISSNSLLRRLR